VCEECSITKALPRHLGPVRVMTGRTRTPQPPSGGDDDGEDAAASSDGRVGSVSIRGLFFDATIMFCVLIIAFAVVTGRPLLGPGHGHASASSPIARRDGTRGASENAWFGHLSAAEAVLFAEESLSSKTIPPGSLRRRNTSASASKQPTQGELLRPEGGHNSTSGKLLWPLLLRSSMVDIGRAAARPHGYRGDLSRVRAGFARATREGKLVVTVFGGSMPLGTALTNHTAERWSNRLEHALRRMGWKGELTVNNFAAGGLPSYTQTPNVVQRKAILKASHLVIVDISINDRFNLANVPADSNHSNDPGFCQPIEGCELMDALLQHCSKSTGIVYFETFPGTTYEHMCPCL
jgi:hypothetical protein